ncbi:hypothetical protein [Nibribacter koreensis]|uniref:Lipoprotein n=1 Tax=Nibribacter koreensis TaxID=1084519 RepID=A0ABP8G132_9BACT
MRYFHSFVVGLCATVLIGCSENKTVQETTTTSSAQTTVEPAVRDTAMNTTVADTTLQTPKQEKVITSLEPQKPSFKVDVINGYLDEFRGCACYFARNEQELKQEKYIYFNDYQQKALVSVNGTKIPLVGAAKGNPSMLNSPYKDPKGRYEVSVSIQDSQQTGDEVASKKGIMQVKDLKTSAIQSLPFVGECGC